MTVSIGLPGIMNRDRYITAGRQRRPAFFSPAVSFQPRPARQVETGAAWPTPTTSANAGRIIVRFRNHCLFVIATKDVVSAKWHLLHHPMGCTEIMTVSVALLAPVAKGVPLGSPLGVVLPKPVV